MVNFWLGGGRNFASYLKTNAIMENEKEQITPPPVSEDGASDAELLRAISAHPAAAQALAAIAAGTDPAVAMAEFAAKKTVTPDASDEDDVSEGIPVASPSFLADIAPDFWENF